MSNEIAIVKIHGETFAVVSSPEELAAAAKHGAPITQIELHELSTRGARLTPGEAKAIAAVKRVFPKSTIESSKPIEDD